MLLRYTNYLIQHHKLVIFISLLFVITAGAGLTNLKTTSNFRICFSEDNPQLVAFEELEKTYGKQDSLLFFIQPKNKNIFTKGSFALITELTEKSWLPPYAIRVNSLTNYQHTIVVGDDLFTDYLPEDSSTLTPTKISEIKILCSKNQASLIF